MPDPPSVNLFSRYVLENPWPAAVILLAIAAGLAWHGAREGLWKRVQLSGLLVLGAIGVFSAASLIDTPGEEAERVVEQFVAAAVANDLTGADRLLAADATLAIGSPRNPGVDINAIRSNLTRLRNYQITANRITSLRGYSVGSDRAVVHLGCLTDGGSGFTGRVPSAWVLDVRAEPDGSWLIERITCISIAGRTPSLNLW